MKKSICFFLLSIFSLISYGQVEKNQKEAIKSVINNFFVGLQSGDSAIVSATLHKNIKIQTTYTNKKGKKLLKTAERSQLLTNISHKKPSDTYFEKLLSWDIKMDGNLASVWTPYEFYLNNKFSHCGANSFQLFNDNSVWKITYLADMRRKNSCKQLKK